jgi:hypothetical protein
MLDQLAPLGMAAPGACRRGANLARCGADGPLAQPAALIAVTAVDRVAPAKLDPLGLPHHRTCGFPHPAVGHLLVEASDV